MSNRTKFTRFYLPLFLLVAFSPTCFSAQHVGQISSITLYDDLGGFMVSFVDPIPGCENDHPALADRRSYGINGIIFEQGRIGDKSLAQTYLLAMTAMIEGLTFTGITGNPDSYSRCFVGNSTSLIKVTAN